MATEILLPTLGESIYEATISRWNKKIGDQVNRGDEILEVETSKATMPIESPVSGYILGILVQEGVSVSVGTLLAVVGKKDEVWKQNVVNDIPAVKEEKSVTPDKSIVDKNDPKHGIPDSIKVSPLAKRMAKEKGIDLIEVQRFFSKETITGEDIQQYCQSLNSHIEFPYHREKISSLKKTIGERMLKSVQEIPQFSVTMDIEVSQLYDYLQQLNTIRNHGEEKVTLTSILLYVTSKALLEHKQLNSMIDHETNEFIVYDTINMSVAVATEEGIRMPVICSIEKKNVDDIVSSVNTLVKKAREGKLTMEEVKDGTFTFSNLGVFGISSFIPLINPPQAAILGVGALIDDIVPNSDQTSENQWMSIKKMNFTINADHRIADGADVARFLSTLKSKIETFSDWHRQ